MTDKKPETDCKGCGCGPTERHAVWCPYLKANNLAPVREEAPAEAGEGVLLSPCARCGGPGKLIHPMGEYVGKGLGEDGGYYGPRGSRVTCQSPASVCCDCTPSFRGPNQDAEAVASWNRRAQPQAREEAQPDTDCVSLLADLDAGKSCGPEAAATIRSLIRERDQATLPAPEAEQLGTALADLVSWFTKPVQGERGLVWVIPAGERGADDAVSEALAALQQNLRIKSHDQV